MGHALRDCEPSGTCDSDWSGDSSLGTGYVAVSSVQVDEYIYVAAINTNDQVELMRGVPTVFLGNVSEPIRKPENVRKRLDGRENKPGT